MAEFCGNCPIRGDCSGQLVEIQGIDYEATDISYFRPRHRYSNVARVVDEDGNLSELFEGVDGESALERIDDCQAPVEKTKDFLSEIRLSNIAEV